MFSEIIAGTRINITCKRNVYLQHLSWSDESSFSFEISGCYSRLENRWSCLHLKFAWIWLHYRMGHDGRLMAVCQARNCVTSLSQGETDSGLPWRFKTLRCNSRSSFNPRVNLSFTKEELSK